MDSKWFQAWRESRPEPHRRALKEQVELYDVPLEDWERLYGSEGIMPRRDDYEDPDLFEEENRREHLRYYMNKFDCSVKELAERFPITADQKGWNQYIGGDLSGLDMD